MPATTMIQQHHYLLRRQRPFLHRKQHWRPRRLRYHANDYPAGAGGDAGTLHHRPLLVPHRRCCLLPDHRNNCSACRPAFGCSPVPVPCFHRPGSGIRGRRDRRRHHHRREGHRGRGTALHRLRRRQGEHRWSNTARGVASWLPGACRRGLAASCSRGILAGTLRVRGSPASEELPPSEDEIPSAATPARASPGDGASLPLPPPLPLRSDSRDRPQPPPAAARQRRTRIAAAAAAPIADHPAAGVDHRFPDPPGLPTLPTPSLLGRAAEDARGAVAVVGVPAVVAAAVAGDASVAGAFAAGEAAVRGGDGPRHHRAGRAVGGGHRRTAGAFGPRRTVLDSSRAPSHAAAYTAVDHLHLPFDADAPPHDVAAGVAECVSPEALPV